MHVQFIICSGLHVHVCFYLVNFHLHVHVNNIFIVLCYRLQAQNVQSICDTRKPSSEHEESESSSPGTLEALLMKKSNKSILQFSEFHLSIDRSSPERFWASVVSFYKGAMHNHEKLKRCLVVDFEESGEQGYDAGALRKEFFDDALTAANEHLFEGNDDRRIPKKDVALELLLEVSGMLFAHSVLQEGPGMPCLSPTVFEYVISGDTSTCYPVKDDIPLNMSTHELISAIEKVITFYCLFT